MAFNAILQSEIAAGQPVTQLLWQKVKDSLDYLYSQVGAGAGGSGAGGGGIPNGSFEIDADADGVPDGWTRNLYPAGGGSLETTSPMHGAKGYKFVQQAGPGNGGGYLDMNDYLPCSPGILFGVAWVHYATAAGMHNLVQARWFDKAKVYLSASDLYNSTNNPTSKTEFLLHAIPPANAQFYKLRVIGGQSDTDIAGTAYFDGFRELYPLQRIKTEGTIPEYYTTIDWYQNAGSVVLHLPALSANCVIVLQFSAEAKLSAYGAGSAWLKFSCGGADAADWETGVAGAYYPGHFTITLPRGVSGDQTLTMWVKMESPSGSIYAYGKKLDNRPIFADIVVP